MSRFTVVVPVYNRPIEVKELLESLKLQSSKNFDIILIEDGSTETCEDVVNEYLGMLDIKYFFKENTGPGDSRNVGMAKATGDYILFFDSDCIIPSDYFQKLESSLDKHSLDAFGGPDSADKSFTKVQKAINYAMTSIITTGGVRGKKNKFDNYQPRSFNMGISKEVYRKVGGFSDIHPGEDPDLSYRIMNAGFKIGLVEEAYVYHKRRIDFSKFIKQVYKFGIVRPILIKWYPDKFKLTYLLPSLFLLFSFLSVLLSSFSVLATLPLLFISFVILVEALVKTKSISISILAILASFIQLYAYGFGFIKSAIQILVLKKNERKVFKDFFFEER